MNKNIIISIAISLLVGGGIGYVISPKQDSNNQVSMAGEHNMQAMSGDMTSMLKDKKGEELDQAFLDGMIIHHQGAIDMAKIVLANTKRPELKQMAESIINSQSNEITAMKTWLNQWYGR